MLVKVFYIEEAIFFNKCIAGLSAGVIAIIRQDLRMLVKVFYIEEVIPVNKRIVSLPASAIINKKRDIKTVGKKK